MKKILSVLLIASLLITGIVSGCTKEPEVLKFVASPGAGPLEEEARWKPVCEYLSNEINIKVEFHPVIDMTAGVVAIQNKHADICRFGAFSYILAVREAGVIPLVREIRMKTGLSSYTAIFLVSPESNIRNLEELRGKTFAFVDVGSTSGYIVPMTMLIGIGINPETNLDKTIFAGSHPAAMVAVIEGKVDATCVSSRNYEIAIKEGILKEENVRIIAESPPIPTTPIAIRPDMSKELQDKIRDAFLNMPQELSEEAFEVSGYTPTLDSDYDFIREMAEALGITK